MARKDAMMPVSPGGYQNQAIADGGSYRHRNPAEGALVPTVPGGQYDGTLPGPPLVSDKETEWLIAREEARQENLQECRGMCVFFAFLIIFTVAMVLDSSGTSARLADHFRTKLEDGPLSLDAIQTIPQTYDYIRHVVVPALYENNTDTNLALALSQYYHPVDVSNRLVGGVRLRQVRVDYTDDCQVGPLFGQYKIKCFPTVGTGTESTTAFGSDLQFTWAADGYGTTYHGYLGTYSPDGFIEVLPTDLNKTLAKLEELQSQNWLGAWTRALFIDFVIWNSNFGTYAVATVNLEYGASGGTAAHVALLTMSPQAMKPGGGGSDEDKQAIAFLVIVFIFLIYFLFEEGQEVKKDVMGYFMDGWNILDWVNMLLLLTAFGIRVFIWIESSSLGIGQAQLTDKDAFASLRGIAVFVEMVKLVNSMNAVILYGKVVKYLRHTPVTRDLINTFWRALELLVPFLVMVCIAFTAFAIAYNVGFGDKIFELSTLGSAISFLSRAFLKDVRLMPAYSYMPMFGALLIVIFYIVFMILGVNVLFAIITDTILRAKWESRAGGRKKDKKPELHEGEPIEEFIREARKRIRKFIKKRSPRMYRMIYRRRRKAMPTPKVEDNNEEEKAELVYADSDSESEIPFEDSCPLMPDKEDLMRSIEHMAGRVLSEVSVVGIEIKSELHEVCERVAQMQMAVEELSMRADCVRIDQEEFLAING